MQQPTKPFTHLNDAEKNELILQTKRQLNISPILIEKDFWVSWLLNKIFSYEIGKKIIFKGGTSLSKCYGLISRFSEDIDLTLDRTLFSNPIDENSLSGKEFKKHLEATEQEAIKFLHDTFKPWLEKEIHEELDHHNWEIIPDDDDKKNLRFYYPATQSIEKNSYVKQSVLLEFGIRGTLTPYEPKTVTSYVNQQFSNLLTYESVPIRTLTPTRTFWEKITLLHAENNRPPEKPMGDRLSRHYYDIHQLLDKGIGHSALENIPLLYDVIEHKQKYFRSAWAKYEEATPKTLKISPNERLESLLKEDYKQMQVMLFGEIPSFNEIMGSIKDFEKQVKALGSSD